MDPEAELYDLKVDSIVRPVGVDNRSPRFGWKMQSDKTGWRQSAYQLTVKDGDKVVWDSGKVESADSTAIAYEGQAGRLAESRHFGGLRRRAGLYAIGGRRCARIPQVVYPL